MCVLYYNIIVLGDREGYEKRRLRDENNSLPDYVKIPNFKK